MRVQAELKKEVQRKYQGKVVAPPGNELIQKKTIFNVDTFSRKSPTKIDL